MTDTLQKVRAKVIEAVPDVMAMRPGTRLYHPKHDKFLRYVGRNNGQYAILVEDTEVMLFVDRLTDCETLGRPIILADVLRAMRKTDDSWYVRYDGTFFKWEKFTEGGDGHHGVESTYITWNLALPLEDQEPDVIEFLAKVLNV